MIMWSTPQIEKFLILHTEIRATQAEWRAPIPLSYLCDTFTCAKSIWYALDMVRIGHMKNNINILLDSGEL